MRKKQSIIISLVLIVIIGIIYCILYIFEGPTTVDKDQDITFLRNYQVNEFVPIYMSDEQMVSVYFNQFLQKMIYQKEEAYNLLDDDFKKNKFPSFDDFAQFVRQKESKLSSLELTSSSVQMNGKKKTYYVSDNDNNFYTFVVEAVMVYKVQFEMK